MIKKTYIIILLLLISTISNVSLSNNIQIDETPADVEDSLSAHIDQIINEKDTSDFDVEGEEISDGYSALEQRKYGKAIKISEKTGKENNDSVYHNVLYLAYLGYNRINESKRQWNLIPYNIKNDYTIKPHKISSLYIEGGLLKNSMKNENDITQQISQRYDLDNNNLYGLLQIGNDITPNLYLTHTVNYYNIKGIQTLTQPGSTTKKDVKFEHIGYTLGSQILFPHQWKIKANGAIFYTQDHYYTTQIDTTPTTQLYTESNTNESILKENETDLYYMGEENPYYIQSPIKKDITNYLIEVKAQKDFAWVNLECGASIGEIEKETIIQPECAVTIYPFENLDLYSKSKIADVINNNNHHLILEEVIGGRICKFVWLECGYTYGNLNNYQENDLTNIYSMLYKTEYKWKTNVIIPINKKISLNLLYNYTLKKIPLTIVEGQAINMKEDTINSNALIGGIKWIF